MDPLDPRLLDRLRAGERAAFDDLAHGAGPALLTLARRLIDDDDAARDVRQEALVRAVRSLGRIEGDLEAWLVRVTVNLCRDHHRRRAARDAARIGLDEAPLAAAHDDPARVVERLDDADRVARAVRSLPLVEREVVVLRHYHDLPFAEIAAAQGAPVTTVQSRLSRGLERLERTLRDPSKHEQPEPTSQRPAIPDHGRV